MIRNVKQIKSTILGAAFIAEGIYMLIEQVGTEYSQLFMIVSGIGLLFAPDRYINALEKWALGREIKVGNNDNTENTEIDENTTDTST